jgi:hypothetical protein
MAFTFGPAELAHHCSGMAAMRSVPDDSKGSRAGRRGGKESFGTSCRPSVLSGRC